MEMKYKVSRELYREYLQAERTEKSRKPLNRVLTLALSAMPPVLVVYLISQGLISGWPAALCAVLALALGAFNWFARTALWEKGKLRIALPGGRGEPGEDFWKEHKLSFDAQGVRLSGGGFKTEYGWAAYGGFREYDGMLLPIFNAQPLDIIPREAAAKFGGAEGLKEAFAAAAREGMRSQTAEARAKLPQDPACLLEYRYCADRYVEDQRDARRAKYRTRLILSKAVLAKLLLTLVMIYAIATAKSAAAIALYAALILVFNYEHIAVFTGLLERRLRRELKPVLALRPHTLARLYVTDEGLTVEGDIHFLELPWREIRCLRTTKKAAALFLANGTILTVPAPPETDGAAFERFLSLVREQVGK